MSNVIAYVCLLIAAICSTSTAQYPPNGRVQMQNARAQILENKLKFLTNQPFNEFDWRLSKALDKNEPGNFVVSPLSVKLAIGMLYLGAQGKAAEEIEEALKINRTHKDTVEQKFSDIMKSLESKEEAYELNIGTRLFHDKSALINKEFETKLKNYYNSTAQPVEFKQKKSAATEINEWCSKITKGKIQQVVTEDNINEGTVVMLLNAIYFRGEWENPFAENETKYDTFWISNTKQVTVQMMSLKEKLCYHNIQEIRTHLFRLPYVGGKFAMYILYPYEVEGLATLAKEISPEILAKSLKQMKEQHISLHLPKFKFESMAALVPILKMLNIKELFNDKTNLDNIGTSGRGPFTISDIIQKSGIEVNEKGSTAYAATNVIIDTRFGMDALELTVNHPFVFLIADESKDMIIFSGKVIDPSTYNFPPPLSVLSSQQEENTVASRIPLSSSEEVLDKHNYFDKELLETIAQINPDSNVIISPASIKAMLALLLEGAAGKTEREIIEALRLAKDKKLAVETLQTQLNSLKNANSAVIIESKNKVYVAQDEKLSQRYSNAIIERYDTQSEPINFAKPEEAANAINTWTKNVTKGLIPTLVSKDDFDASTKLFLANCIYFKGEWQMEFDAKYTHTRCFYDSANVCQTSTFINTRQELNYYEAEDLDAKLVEIPFGDERYSLVIILPNKNDGVLTLLKDLHHKSILDLFGQMKKLPLVLTIPRTTIEFALPLNDALKQLNIKDVFETTANLSGLLEMNKPIAVSKMIHKAKIEINEKGAKAAASTGVQVVLLIAPAPDTEFKADHPFIFFIRDNRESGFLFEGILASPDNDPASLRPNPVLNRVPQPSTTPSILRNSFTTPVAAPAASTPRPTTRRVSNTKRPVTGYQMPRPTVNGSVEYPIYQTYG